MTVDFGHRRRCSWCGVQLRWWQINLCRDCKAHVVYGGCMGGPPCPEKSRWGAAPDTGRWWVEQEPAVTEPKGFTVRWTVREGGDE